MLKNFLAGIILVTTIVEAYALERENLENPFSSSSIISEVHLSSTLKQLTITGFKYGKNAKLYFGKGSGVQEEITNLCQITSPANALNTVVKCTFPLALNPGKYRLTLTGAFGAFDVFDVVVSAGIGC